MVASRKTGSRSSKDSEDVEVSVSGGYAACCEKRMPCCNTFSVACESPCDSEDIDIKDLGPPRQARIVVRRCHST